MINIKKKIWSFILILLFLITISSFGSLAQEKLVLTISPVKFELQAVRGEKIIKEVSLENSSSKKVDITTDMQDFVAQGEEGKPSFVTEEKSPWSMSKWIKAKPSQFILNPGEKKKVEVTIKVPKDGEPGGHYAAVIFSSTPSKEGTGIQARVGALILLKVAGKIIEKGKVILLSPRLVDRGPIDINVRFKNEGNVHVKPEGKVKIKRLWGRKIKELKVGNENVLPKSSRLFHATWKDIPTFGVFVSQAELKFGSKKKEATSSKVLLFIIPWKLILIGIALFFLGYIFNYIRGRKKKKKELKSDQITI